MNRFDSLRPTQWDETIDETLDAIEREANKHTTERLVLMALDIQNDDIEDGQVEWAVSKMRARAVVLAFELERIRETIRTAWEGQDQNGRYSI